MEENIGRYYPDDRRRAIEVAAAWVIVVAVVLDALFLGVVAWTAWKVERESRRVFAELSAEGQSCKQSLATGAPVRYENPFWKVSFELPSGYYATEQFVDSDKTVELRVARRPSAEDAASSNALYDTSVRVRIGKANGFSRYYAKPYSEYGSYRRFTAVGRAAIGYTDPEGAADSVQVIHIDDTRNDREVTVIYTAVEEGAEALAFDIIDTMRLVPREAQEVVLKPGWKIFTQDPMRLQYPEDYRVTTPTVGQVFVTGKGGRIEISSSYDLGSSGKRGASVPSNGDGGTPDEFFLLQYGVRLRVAFYYANDATSYDRSVLKEIGATIGLKE